MLQHFQAIALTVLGTLMVLLGCSLAIAWKQFQSGQHLLAQVIGTKTSIEVEIADDSKIVGVHPRILTPVKVIVVAGKKVTPARAVLFSTSTEFLDYQPGQKLQLVAKIKQPLSPTYIASLTAVTVPARSGDPPWYQKFAAMLRKNLRQSSIRTLSSPSSTLLPGFVVGDTSAVSAEMKAKFSAAGLTHLMAVSGANFAIITGLVLWAVRGAGVPPQWSAVITLLVVISFVILVRPTPSVVRAAIMGSVTLVALWVGRERQAMPALCVAIIGSLILWPELALDLGFGLSVAATAGLILYVPAITKRLIGWGMAELLAQIFSVAIAATLVTFPIILMSTGRLSLISLLANIIVTPTIPVITIVGTAALLCATPWAQGADLLLSVLVVPLKWIVYIVNSLGSKTYLSIEIPTLGMRTGVVLLGVVIILLPGRLKRRRLKCRRLKCSRQKLLTDGR